MRYPARDAAPSRPPLSTRGTLALAITTTTHTEQDLVQAWREQRILELGYQPEIAEVCALAEVDWHRLEHLIVNGCPLDTAIAILA